jgi:hypothetical protein
MPYQKLTTQKIAAAYGGRDNSNGPEPRSAE